MRTWAKLAAFAAMLAVVFAAASAIGAAVGPIELGGDDHEQVDSHPTDTVDEGRPPATTMPPVEQSIDAGDPAVTVSHDDGVHGTTSTNDVSAEGGG